MLSDSTMEQNLLLLRQILLMAFLFHPFLLVTVLLAPPLSVFCLHEMLLQLLVVDYQTMYAH